MINLSNRIVLPLGSAAIILFAVLLYWPSLRLGFLGDDFLDLDHGFGPGSFFVHEAGGFRPLIVMVWAFDSAVYGCTNAWGWHLTNLLFHLTNAVLIWLLLGRLGFKRFARLAGFALFLISFASVPSAARVSGRTSMIAMLPLLLSFYCFAGWVRSGSKGYPWAAGGLLLVSLFAKEMALAAPLAFGAIGLYIRGMDKRRLLRSCMDVLLLLAPVMIYIVWRLLFTGYQPAYGESTAFGFFMVRNMVTLGAMAWAPWLSGIPIRLLVLAFAVFLLLPQIRLEMKILFLVMTAALLLTVSNLPPRSYYAYASLPAAAILFAGIASSRRTRVVIPVCCLLLLGSFLESRDEVSRMSQASNYVDRLTQQLNRIDGELEEGIPIFVHGIDFDIAGYSTVWPGDLEKEMECAGYPADRIIAEDAILWEQLYEISDGFNNAVDCRIVADTDEGVIIKSFSTATRRWDADDLFQVLEVPDNILYVNTEIWKSNCLYFRSESPEARLVLENPLVRGTICTIEPAFFSGDTVFFDLENSTLWLASDTPFMCRLTGMETGQLQIVLSARRIWLEELEERLALKEEQLYR